MNQPIKLVCLAGDGIGPEIMQATLQILHACAPKMIRPLQYEEHEIGFVALKNTGTTLPNAVIEAARKADGVILGPVSHNDYPPRQQGGLNPSGELRKALNLYANIRPAHTYDGLEHKTTCPFDLVMVRENLEGFYSDRNMASGSGEFLVEEDVALAIRKITKKGSRRIAQAAFALAQTRQNKKVTAIHKANVLRVSDGLFLDTVRSVAVDYPDVVHEEMIVDAAAAHLVRDPAQFEIVLCTNMFGDILSDLASELSGGLGIAGSLNHGDVHFVAQAQHGSAPTIANQDLANPSSLILSAAMLLRALGEKQVAGAIEQAVKTAVATPKSRTQDLGGTLGTTAYTQTLCALAEEIINH